MAVRRFVLMATKQAFVTGFDRGTAVSAKVEATCSSVAMQKELWERACSRMRYISQTIAG
jgi:hypothetical protein